MPTRLDKANRVYKIMSSIKDTVGIRPPLKRGASQIAEQRVILILASLALTGHIVSSLAVFKIILIGSLQTMELFKTMEEGCSYERDT